MPKIGIGRVCGFLTVIRKESRELTSANKCRGGAKVITTDRKCVPRLREFTRSEGGTMLLSFSFPKVK